jgi:hypothetical protein
MLLATFETSLGNGQVLKMGGSSPEYWDDDDCACISIKLPHILGPDVDVNVHEDRVLIRISELASASEAKRTGPAVGSTRRWPEVLPASCF